MLRGERFPTMSGESRGNPMDQRDTMNEAIAWQIHWGRLLRTARQVAGLSLTDLASVTGLSKGYLSKLESGHATALNPSRDTLAALALALPSFRPIAHSLGPVADVGPVAVQPDPREMPRIAGPASAPEPEAPIRLGWRELEVVLVVLTLERAAAVQSLTSVVIARALGRECSSVEIVLTSLVCMRVLRRRPSTRPGGPASYQCAPDFEARIGITRPGDALVLAAALLAEAPARSMPSHSHSRYRQPEHPDTLP